MHNHKHNLKLKKQNSMYNRRAIHKQMKQHRSDNFPSCNGYARKKAWKEKFATSFNSPPANVRELDDKYELHLFAPGLEKSDFIIALMDQVLSITVKEKTEENGTWKRLEYSLNGFVRKFELSEKVDKTAIEAKYENGVLIVSLAKMEGFETVRKEIEIV